MESYPKVKLKLKIYLSEMMIPSFYPEEVWSLEYWFFNQHYIIETWIDSINQKTTTYLCCSTGWMELQTYRFFTTSLNHLSDLHCFACNQNKTTMLPSTTIQPTTHLFHQTPLLNPSHFKVNHNVNSFMKICTTLQAAKIGKLLVKKLFLA